MTLEVGSTVGMYRLVERIGEGGMATVYMARHTVLDRLVALKVLHPSFLDDPDFPSRFRREARVVASFDHPNIVPIWEFAEHEGLPYLVMKFVDGQSLKTSLCSGPLSKDEGVRIIEAIGEALIYAHDAGVLHRDVKPSNVLLSSQGAVFLADFGLARVVAEGESTLSREMTMGTAEYISPEQIRAQPDLDERTDIYSLGVLIHEMVTGHVPYGGEDAFAIMKRHLYSPLPGIREQVPHVSTRLERFIDKAMAKNREDRYSTMKQMLLAFREVADGPMGVLVAVDPPATVGHPKDLPADSSDRQLSAALLADGGLRFPLDARRLLVGRADPTQNYFPDIDLTEAEPEHPATGIRRRTVHREQAWIHWMDEGWWIEIFPGKDDRVRLNGRAMTAGQRYRLRSGDKLTLGAVELEVKA